MPNIRIIIEYNGSGFHGWQIQHGVRTIQAELSKAIATVLRMPIGTLHAAGRTDSGVHAKGQVVSFKVDGEVDFNTLIRGVSHILRPELSIRSAEVVPDNFHPGRRATRKLYQYTILNRDAPAVLDYGRVWHVGRELNRQEMKEQVKVLVGEHDFSGFRDSECTAKSPIKKIFRSEIIEQGEYLIYCVEGSGFLKQMVRNIVGSIVEIGKGRPEAHSMQEILDSRDRRIAGPTAPPYGLCMEWVKYE